MVFKVFLPLFICGLLYSQDISKGKFVYEGGEITPLSAVFLLDETNTKPITVRVKGKTEAMDIAHTYPSGYGKEFPIYGFYPDYINTVSVEQSGEKRTFRVITKSFSDKLNIQTQVFVDNLETPDPFNQDLFFVNILSQRALIAYDRAGDIRYLLRKEIYSFIRIEPTPAGMVVHNTEKNGAYVMLDLLGRELKRFSTDQLHHDLVLINGNYVLPSLSQWGWEDAISEFTPDGRLISKKYLGDVLRKAAASQDEELINQAIYDDQNIYQRDGKNTRLDWAHANGLAYQPETDTLIISLRHQGVFAVKYKSWKLLWWFVDEGMTVDPGFGYARIPRGVKKIADIPSLQRFRLQTGPRQGPRNQHAPLFTSKGTLLLFDNNGEIRKNPEGSRAVEYAIRNDKAELVREFRHPQKFYSRVASDIDLAGPNNENWLILWSETYPNRLIEVAPDNNILYDISFKTKQLFYRADKMPLYLYQDTKKKYSID